MDKLIRVIGTSILGMAMIGFIAVFSGTIIWIVWPAAAQVFPAATSAGYFVARISWWQAVALSWIVSALIKSPRPTIETKI